MYRNITPQHGASYLIDKMKSSKSKLKSAQMQWDDYICYRRTNEKKYSENSFLKCHFTNKSI